MFFSKPMKKTNSVLHWEKQQKAKISKKAIAAFLAPAEMCLQTGFCFKAPTPVTWQCCSRAVHPSPFFLQFLACLLLTLSSRATKSKESGQRPGAIGMRNTLSPYVGHCWRTVLCMYSGPASVSSPITALISPVPACGSLGWKVVSALQVPSHRLCPHRWPREIWHLQAASSTAKGSRGPIMWRMHLYLFNSKEMGWNLSLCDKQWIAVDRHFLYECNLLCHYQFMFI